MRACRFLAIYISSAVLILWSSAVTANPEDNWDAESARIVVAIRYLQVRGTSHGHLYVYRGDGKFLRQLTASEAGHDCDPVFSSDGKQVVFCRREKSGDKFWTVRVENARARSLDAAPEWYRVAIKQHVAKFDYPPFVPLPHDPHQQRLSDYVKPGDVVYSAPDNSVDIVLKDNPSEAHPAADWYPKDPYLRNSKTQTDIPVSKLPFVSLGTTSTAAENEMRHAAGGGEPYSSTDQKEVGNIDGMLFYNASPFLLAGPLRVAFVRQHRGSTFCEGFFALDLNTQRVYEVTPNCGEIIPISEAPAFFCICNERYLPLGDGKRTVNCSFLDLWTSDLKHVRFSKPKVARYSGGSIFRPHADQPVTIIREQQESD